MDAAALQKILAERRRQAIAAFEGFDAGLERAIVDAATRMSVALLAGRSIFACGNGGSAADAQHFAAELAGRYLKERRALPAIALTTNSSALTAIANDYDYERVFARQLEGLGRRGDVLLAISTSGKSKSVLRAAEVGKELGMQTIGLVGAAGGALAAKVDIALAVPSRDTPRIQECHLFVLHSLCELLEEMLAV